MAYSIKNKLANLLVYSFISVVCATILFSAQAHANQTRIENSEVIVGMRLEPPNLDPTSGAAAAIDEVVYTNLFEGLTRFASDGSIVPALAKSWDIINDDKTYRFHLQKNVTFHDGSAFSANDVKFSLDRAASENSSNAQKGLFKDIKSVNVIDDNTVEINLTKPNGKFTYNLAWGDAVIVSKKSVDTNAVNPIGTGPFKFSAWKKGDNIQLTKYQDYWGKKPELNGVTFRFISDATAAYAAMISGDVDVFPIFPSPETIVQFESDSRFKVVVGSTEGETILAMNHKSPHLANVQLRKAISHAINRQDIINGAMFGYGTPIGSHFPPHNPAYIDLTKNSAYDPELAKSIINKLGLKDITLNLKLPPPTYARRGGEIIAKQLTDIGLNIEIENIEWAQWLEQVFRNKEFDLSIVSHSEPSDINIYANPEYYFQYDNSDFQKLINELDAISDSKKRDKLLKKAQTMLAKDYANGFLFQLAKTGVAKVKLMGMWENAPTQANDMTGVYWEK